MTRCEARAHRAPGAGAGGADRGARVRPLARLPLPRAARRRQARPPRAPSRPRSSPPAAEDPDDARRRALLDPSPHPDLVWLAPRGAQHLVEEVRERVIRAAAYRPFEGGKRVFVVEAAEAMRDESQNALLKTLEEPPDFVHLILLSSEPEALLETIASRCQPVDFAPLSPEVLEAELAADGRWPATSAHGGWPGSPRRSPRPPGSPPATSSARGCCSARAAARSAPRPSAASPPRSTGEVAVGALEAPARPRRGRRRGRRSGDPRGARGGGQGRPQTHRPRHRRRVQTRRPPPPHRDPRPRPRALRRLAARPRRARRRRRGGRLQPRPPRPAARPGRRPRPRPRPPRRRAGPGDPPQPRPQRLRGAGPRGAVLQARADCLA